MMTEKFKLKEANMGLTAIVYTTPKGNSYTFYNNIYTNVFDDFDVKYFENHGSVSKFEVESKKEVIKAQPEKKVEVKIKRKIR